MRDNTPQPFVSSLPTSSAPATFTPPQNPFTSATSADVASEYIDPFENEEDIDALGGIWASLDNESKAELLGSVNLISESDMAYEEETRTHRIFRDPDAKAAWVDGWKRIGKYRIRLDGDCVPSSGLFEIKVLKHYDNPPHIKREGVAAHRLFTNQQLRSYLTKLQEVGYGSDVGVDIRIRGTLKDCSTLEGESWEVLTRPEPYTDPHLPHNNSPSRNLRPTSLPK
ncbi:hypothetical protein HK097_003728 [Rhizophlyctis rosea]|uniref:Uncharacterized protein n=1 Tax=Rhizophlyctis rosea TaxID=64517 RepID=A0AAD5SR82_9FUNG|nr:hypothetical protein HK097_003728 [Rhizophlyctis rosea]